MKYSKTLKGTWRGRYRTDFFLIISLTNWRRMTTDGQLLHIRETHFEMVVEILSLLLAQLEWTDERQGLQLALRYSLETGSEGSQWAGPHLGSLFEARRRLAASQWCLLKAFQTLCITPRKNRYTTHFLQYIVWYRSWILHRGSRVFLGDSHRMILEERFDRLEFHSRSIQSGPSELAIFWLASVSGGIADLLLTISARRRLRAPIKFWVPRCRLSAPHQGWLLRILYSSLRSSSHVFGEPSVSGAWSLVRK